MNKTLIHGGDWAGYEERFHRPALDFSANISPLGVPEGVKRAFLASADRLDRYPDPLCRRLREALSRREGIPPEQILCGSGGADLIFRAVQAIRPKTALITAPAFGEYESALRTVDCRVLCHILRQEEDFRLGEDFLGKIVPGLDLVFLCQPNNPTGIAVPEDLLERILWRCREAGAAVVLDECFCDLMDQPGDHRSLLGKIPGLILLRSMTKLYAIAGLRLGYCLCADRALLDRMEELAQPWSVSLPAQEAGAAALEEEDYARRVQALIREQRPVLKKGLEELGLRVIPGQANFLLFRCGRELTAPLAERGILVRSCGNYRGLDKSWYRIAVRTGEENRRLLAALREVLE